MCEAQWNKSVREKVYRFAVHRKPLMETHMFKRIFVASAMAFTALSAVAAPAASDAQTHFQAIAAGDVAAVMHGYADAAHFVWVGGPLDGTYTGVDAIRQVWEKFTKSQGTMKVAVDKVEEASNPKGSSVTANVTFQGKQPIKVRYVLTYRDNKIVSETWQIDPKLGPATY
jgi:ketosteroid isomerase-like protein